MSNPIFRKTALERLSSPDQLDQLLHVTSSRSWLALMALGMLLLCAIFWGCYGSIPEKVTGQGILIQPSGIFNVLSLSTGQIQDIVVQEKYPVQAGQVVARVYQPELMDKIQETRKKLTDLTTRQKQLIKFGSTDIQLQTVQLAQKRRDLTETNRALESQMDWLKQRESNQQHLLEKGLISSQTLLDTRQKSDSIRQQIQANRLEQSQTVTQELEIKNQREDAISLNRQEVNSIRESLASLQNQLEATTAITSPYSGRVLGVLLNSGSLVKTGDAVLKLELSGQGSDDLHAVIFIHPAEGKKVRPGMSAHISPSTVRQEEFGFIQGLITQVDDFPLETAEMYRILQNDKMVSTLFQDGAPIQVIADLIPDPSTVSGYLWSSAKGPPVGMYSGTMCSVAVTVQEQPPLQLLIPLFKKNLLGEGP